MYCKLRFQGRLFFAFLFNTLQNGIGVVMVSVLAMTTIDRGFDPGSGKHKDY
jgi:hypothetical protein